MLLIGFTLLFYPDFSTWWNSRIQAGVIGQYQEAIEGLTEEQIDEFFRRAYEVNAELAALPPSAPLLIAHAATVPDDYMDILRIGRIMGRVEIPKISVNLPIYHTTHSHVLDLGVGHLEGTAFPIGGYGTHSVLTAHSGLANARLFTDLEGNITYGDYFFIEVLNRRLAYRVDQILIVWPHEIESLRVSPGEDFVTLITCTPYAVNSHRLLVRGYRVPLEVAPLAEEIETESVSNRVDFRVYIFLGFFALFMLGFMIYQIITSNRKANPVEEIPPIHPFPFEPLPIYEPLNPAASNSSIQRDPRDTPTSPWDTPSSSPNPQLTPATGSLLGQYMAKAKTGGSATNSAMAAPMTAKPLYQRPAPKRGRLDIIGKIKSNRNITAACIIALLLVVVGIGIFIFRPQVATADYQSAIDRFVTRIEDYRAVHNERVVADMMDRWQDSGELEIIDMDDFAADPFAGLMHEVQEYNRRISNGNQPSLPDPFSYSQSGFSLEQFGFDEEMIGYIAIPRLDTQLPIFLGASRENLRRGLAHLTGTSLPVGGTSTNAVIAGHMTAGRNSLLAGIESLEIGDELRITNFYDTLIYKVTDIQLVYPHQTQDLMVQSGNDIITLLAYREGDVERYMIVAQRANYSERH